jgi:hypothetical protein
MCAVASNPVRPRPPWSRPRSQATPSGQPVSFRKSVKTSFAELYSGVAHARTVIEIMAKPLIDQMMAVLLTSGIIEFPKALITKAIKL